MARVGSVGADLIREPRRDVRLSRTRSATTEVPGSVGRITVRGYPPIRRGHGRVPRPTLERRRMALSEAIPIATAAWVSPRLNPSYEKRLGAAGKTAASATELPGSVGRITVRGYPPIHRGHGRVPRPTLVRRRMALSEAIPIATAAWVSPRLNPSYEKRLGAAGKTAASATELPGSVGRITVRGYPPIHRGHGRVPRPTLERRRMG